MVRTRLYSDVRQAEDWFDIRNFGAACDGSTDDTDAIDAAIEAMPTIAGSFNASSGVLYLPAGRTITRGGHVVPAGKRISVRGAGPYVSILYRATGATDDLLTINAMNSGVRDLTLDGNGALGGSGDCVVLNAAYTYIQDATLANAAGDGFAVGKAAGAIGFYLRDVLVRNAKGNGGRIYSGTSTDGTISSVNIGKSGKHGLRVGASAQLMTLVHVWESGLESATDYDGFHFESGGSVMVGCESETNLGNGVFLGGSGINGTVLSGCYIWGNALAGVRGFNSRYHTITGGRIKSNGVANVAGSTSTAYAGIQNESGREWAIDGVAIYDDFQAIPAGSYSVAPTYPYPGRSAIGTQSFNYAELDGGTDPDENVITGCQMRGDMTRSGTSVVSLGAKNVFSGNQLGTVAVPSVAAATSITLPAWFDLIDITGTSDVATIAAVAAGRRVTLLFSDASPGDVLTSGNIILSSTFSPAQNATISLICDGASWREVGRSA